MVKEGSCCVVVQKTLLAPVSANVTGRYLDVGDIVVVLSGQATQYAYVRNRLLKFVTDCEGLRPSVVVLSSSNCVGWLFEHEIVEL